eukprot:m.101021 g.101021  ORF g.101021 m.101021 type:complete len:867 (-) comp15155_c0_seq1:48-2648(-)
MLEDGTYCYYGTGVEIPEDDEPAKKKVLVQDQVVTDAQGRRRFHGAFTGGFSAGYYNTVGSKEGWAPSTFKSTRRTTDDGDADVNRRLQQQSIHDFMDEEDMAESGFAPKQVRATGEFKQAEDSTSAKRKAMTGEESKALQYLETLVQPSSENVGRKLLQLMGWRQGQGIGPRISARRQTPGYNNPADDRLFDDIAAGKGVTFAPLDAKVTGFKAKDNFHGIGYQGMSAGDFAMDASKRKRAMGGFGTGAFEELDDDIYDADAGDKSQYSRTLTSAEDEPTMRPTFRSRSQRQLAIAGGSDDFSGPSRFALHGFVKSSGQLVPRTVYPGHRPPKDFNPFHIFKEPGPLSKGLLSQRAMRDMTKLSAHQRAHLLGEQAPPRPPPPSLSQFQSQDQTQDEPLAPQDKMDKLRRDVYRPFKSDPDKQQRYEAFLQGHHARGRRQSTIDHEAEKREFEQARRLYKPLSKIMSLRFQPASSTETADKGSLADEIRQLEEKQAQEDDAQAAAKMKMFGKLTRSMHEWHPHRMLSRRFNLPDPYPASGVVGIVTAEREATHVPRNKTRWDQVGRVDAMTLAAAGLQQAAQQEKVRQAQSQVEQHQQAVNAKFADIKPLEPAAKPLSSDIERAAIDAEAEEEAARLPKRPDVDLFKAIFSDDSEDEEADVAVENPSETGDSGPEVLSVDKTATASQAPSTLSTDPASTSTAIVAAPTTTTQEPDKAIKVTKQPLSNSANSDFVSKTSRDARAPRPQAAQPLELQHHHPLASTTAVAVVKQGSKVQIKLTHLQDDDDDWEEVATLGPQKDKKKRKKHKKEKKSKKSKRHHRERDSTDEVDDRVLLAKLKNVGGIKSLATEQVKRDSSRPSAADYM